MQSISTKRPTFKAEGYEMYLDSKHLLRSHIQGTFLKTSFIVHHCLDLFQYCIESRIIQRLKFKQKNVKLCLKRLFYKSRKIN